MDSRAMRSVGACALLLAVTASASAQPTRQTETYRRFKAYLDAVPAVDTHDHLLPFEQLRQFASTEYGPGMNLAAIFQKSYYTNVHPLTPYKPGMAFDDWWAVAKHNFDNARAASFYQYQLSAFKDLYGVDFETLTDEQAKVLDRRIYDHYKTRDWVEKTITERANVELIVNDPFWSRLYEVPDYKFCALVFNVTQLVHGFNATELASYAPDDPYKFAREHKMKVEWDPLESTCRHASLSIL